MISGLPSGWTWARVAELAGGEPNALTDGPFGSNLKTEHYTDHGPRVIRLQNVGNCAFLHADAHISSEHFARLRRYEVRSGDVVLAILGDPVPRACVLPEGLGPAIIKADCPRLRVERKLTTPRFTMYAMCSEAVRKQAAALVHGVGRRISLRDLRDLKVPLPPKAEQSRIVEAIETQLTRLDAGVAALERVQANLKRYRASVLKAAVEGRLVPTEAELARREGRDYEPAAVLLQRILAERRRRWEQAALAAGKAKGKTPKDAKRKAKYEEPVAPDTTGLSELPEGWCWAKVGVLGDVQLGRQRSPKYHNGPNMRPYLRVANVFEDRIDITDIMKMNFGPSDYQQYRLSHGDILLNEGQSLELVGRPAIYRNELPGACFTNTLVRFRPYPPLAPEFSLCVFRSYMRNGRFQRIAKITTNIAHLGAGRFADLAFPLPPLAEQLRITDEVSRLLTIADKLERDARHEHSRCQFLRQCILKWAFEGKLVDQDPKDEPASVLLDRIRAERAKEKALIPEPSRTPRKKRKAA